jgi:hypothetical protein
MYLKTKWLTTAFNGMEFSFWIFFEFFFFGSNVLNVTSWFDFCWTRMTRRFFPPRFEINSKWVLFKCTKQCHKIVSFKKMLLFIDVAIYNARLALRDLLWSGFSFRLWSFSHVRTAEVENARAIKSVRSAAAETEPRTF